MDFKDITHLRERQNWIENATRLLCPSCSGIVATQMNVLMDKIDELSELPEKLREMEKDQKFPTEEDRRGYGVACLDLHVLRDRIGKGNFDFPKSDCAPRFAKGFSASSIGAIEQVDPLELSESDKVELGTISIEKKLSILRMLSKTTSNIPSATFLALFP